MMAEAEHYRGCHPADDRAPETPEGHKPQATEECWHCGTPTDRGCECSECWDNADSVSPSAVHHCPTCGRWWAYMRINIASITFGTKE